MTNLLPVPQDGGDGDEDTDPLAGLKADIRNAHGAGLLLETTSAGWGEGRASAPQGDYNPKRYGPTPPAPLIDLSAQGFSQMLAASGASLALFGDADGTSQREAFRRYLTLTVLPMSNLLVRELQDKLSETCG